MSATESVPATSAFEAVIISGPRRGEIIHLPDNDSVEISSDDFQMLNEVLDLLISKLENLSREIRLTTDAMKPRTEIS